jgi:hypothetical protein
MSTHRRRKRNDDNNETEDIDMCIGPPGAGGVGGDNSMTTDGRIRYFENENGERTPILDRYDERDEYGRIQDTEMVPAIDPPPPPPPPPPPAYKKRIGKDGTEIPLPPSSSSSSSSSSSLMTDVFGEETKEVSRPKRPRFMQIEDVIRLADENTRKEAERLNDLQQQQGRSSEEHRESETEQAKKEEKHTFWSALQGLKKFLKEERSREESAKKLAPLTSLLSSSSGGASGGGPEGTRCKGEMLFEKLLQMPALLARLNGMQLETAQKDFITEFCFGVAPFVYGAKEWEANKARFFQKYRRTKVTPQVMCLTPRRWGKTTSVILFVLSLLLVVPRIRIAVFSQNLRTSRTMVELAKQYLARFPGGKDRLVVDSADQLKILDEDSISTCRTIRQKRSNPNNSSMKALPASDVGMFLFLSFSFHSLHTSKHHFREKQRFSVYSERKKGKLRLRFVVTNNSSRSNGFGFGGCTRRFTTSVFGCFCI